MRVIAPVPAGAHAVSASDSTLPNSTNAPVSAAAATAPPDSAPAGETGTIYMSLSEAQGQLRQIKRSPTGRPIELTIEIRQVSPEWTGGVAFNESGALIGIVDESDANEARVIAAAAVRAAAARVQARRASVPQAWLGARGDAVTTKTLQFFVLRGWPEQEARALLSRQQGVLLTDVAPGTPAARAGLRSGDVVARIGQHDVRSVEEMTQLIQELGSNTVAKFTVLRAQAPPVELNVRLSEARNPALETAQAEARAAESEAQFADSDAQLFETEARLLAAEARQMQTELRAQENALRAADAAHRVELQQRLAAAQRRLHDAQTRLVNAQMRVTATHQRQAAARQRYTEAEARMRAASAAHFGLPVPALLSYGVEAIRIWPPGAQSADAQAGLLVVGVRPQSMAARVGVQTGDIIETINEQRITDDWRDDDANQQEMTYTCGVVRKGQRLTLKLASAPEK